jgi:enamine deaminase RidA (YjgF/YER057c/UK114 family)
MTLERVWPKDVYVRRVPNLIGKLYAQVIKATGTRVSIHVAGTLSFDKDNNLVGEGSMQLQVRAVLDAIGKSLAAVSAQRSDVVRTKTYVTDMAAYLREGHQEYLSFFGDKPPVSTTVGVTVLADPRCLVEIEAYAETE